MFGLSIVFLLTLLLGAFGFHQGANAYKGELKVALTGEPSTMDPHIRTGFIDQMAWRHVYDPLVHLEAGTGKVLPWLATKWEKLSPTKIKFELRKGAKFIDGTPVTSEAVKFSIERVFDPALKGTAKGAFKTFDRVEIIDDHTFIWHLKESDNGLFNTLFFRPMIMSPKAKEESLAKMALHPIGSGPYVLKSWKKGQEMVFDANPNWWGNELYPNRPAKVTFRRISESTTRVKALLTGEVDVIQGVLPQFISQIKNDPGTAIATTPSTRVMMMGFFSRHGGPMADLNVRKAINYAINTEAIQDAFLKGLSHPIGQMFHPWSYTGYNPDKKWYEFDLNKAKEHIKKSGYPNGFKATLITAAGRFPADKQTCEAVVGMLKDIQIQAICRSLKWPLYRKQFSAYASGKQKDPAMYYMGMGNATGNPFAVGITQTGCKGGYSGACFKEVEDAFNKANATVDPKEQQLAFEKVTDFMKAYATHKIFFNVNVTWGFRKKEIAFQPRHDELFFAWDVEMK